MTPDITNVELNRLRGIRYIVSVTLPTVYYNTLSYYEVCGKLIVELNNIRANQDDNAENMNILAQWIHEQLEEQEAYLQQFHTDFTRDLDQYLKESQAKWDKFIAQELAKYNAYYSDITNRMAIWTNNFKTAMATFKTELTNKHNSYDTYLTNRHNTHTTNLESMINEYKTYIANQKIAITNDLRSKLDEVITKYENLLKSIATAKESMTTIINNKASEWNKLVDDFILRFKNAPERILQNNDILKQIIDYLRTLPDELRDVGTPLYTMINYVNDSEKDEPVNPKAGEIWLTKVIEADGMRDIEYQVLRRYDGTRWITICDNELYMTSDYHLYICDNIALPLATDEEDTLLPSENNEFNTSAWWIPVGYDRNSYKYKRPVIYSLQQYNTATENEIDLTYNVHSYHNCVSPRGYGANNLKYKNINNDFQRILVLQDGTKCIHIGRGLYVGDTFGTNEGFPNPYPNNCNTGEDTPIYTGGDFTLVTGLLNIGYPIVYSTQYEQYYAYYNKQFIPIGTSQPRFSVGTRIYSFMDNGDSPINQCYYIDLTDPDTRHGLASPTHNEIGKEYATLQLSEDNKYIYSTNKVWLYTDFIKSMENGIFNFKPILTLPTSCEHAHIYNDTLYTTHTNYVIDLLNPLPDKFRPADVDIKANGIWAEDTSTWVNGFIYFGMFWQFSLINETDPNVPHKTVYNMQGFRKGAREISYVPISSSND